MNLEDAYVVFYESILFVFHNMHHLMFRKVSLIFRCQNVTSWVGRPAFCQAIHDSRGVFWAAIPLISKHYRDGHYGAPHLFCMVLYIFVLYNFVGSFLVYH